MTTAGKSQSKSDVFDRQFWLIDQQVTRNVQPPLHDVGMWRNPRALAATNGFRAGRLYAESGSEFLVHHLIYH
jgi:hypothetical protein